MHSGRGVGRHSGGGVGRYLGGDIGRGIGRVNRSEDGGDNGGIDGGKDGGLSQSVTQSVDGLVDFEVSSIREWVPGKSDTDTYHKRQEQVKENWDQHEGQGKCDSDALEFNSTANTGSEIQM
eukprot:15354016-Ditylum_brightwellii.AAC.1